MVVVTGASGHVGGTLIRDLLARGATVRALVHGETPAPTLAGLDVEIVRGDVRDPASLRAAFQGADTVYHLAAIISVSGDPDGNVRKVNVDGARNAAEAALAAGVRRHVHVSSVHAFDHAPHDTPLDETRARPTPRHPAYDQSKAAGEAAVREVIARGLDAVIVNPSAILGPYDPAPSHMGTAMLQMARSELPVLPAGGFDWVDVRDVTRSIVAAAERGRTGENYLLPGAWHTVAHLAACVERAVGVRAPRLTVPLGLLEVSVAPASLVARMLGQRPLWTFDSIHALRSNRVICGDKAARELGHTRRPIEDTVRDALAWFVDAGMLRGVRVAALQAAS